MAESARAQELRAEARRRMADVVPWHEMTPQAQVAMKDELERLVAQTPAQASRAAGMGRGDGQSGDDPVHG